MIILLIIICRINGSGRVEPSTSELDSSEIINFLVCSGAFEDHVDGKYYSRADSQQKNSKLKLARVCAFENQIFFKISRKTKFLKPNPNFLNISKTKSLNQILNP